VQSFNNFFKSQNPMPKHRHMSAFDSQPHNRKSVDFVPKYMQAKADNAKLVNLKKGTSQLEYLTPADVKQICSKFNCQLIPNKVVKLGNTGIKAYYKDGKPVISIICRNTLIQDPFN